MRNWKVTGVLFVALGLLAAPVFAACGQAGGGQGKGMRYGMNQVNHQGQSMTLSQFELAELSDEQKAEYRYMWEEEKLAKDVYTYFGNLYGARVFNNIKQSEQRHQDAMKALLDRYEIEVDDSLEPGKFADEALQQLYDDFLAKGNQSLRDALEVGRTIEVADIADLEAALENAPPDAAMVFENLLQASQRHLSAFERNLSRY